MSGMSGGTPMPGQPVTGTRTYTYPMNQRAATLWYHDHRMGFTGASVWLGLAGFHLVHDDEVPPGPEQALPRVLHDRFRARRGDQVRREPAHDHARTPQPFTGKRRLHRLVYPSPTLDPGVDAPNHAIGSLCMQARKPEARAVPGCPRFGDDSVPGRPDGVERPPLSVVSPRSDRRGGVDITRCTGMRAKARSA